MYAGQPGAVGQDANGFAIFPDYSTGFQALQNQITLDASRGLSIQQFTSKYAPASAGNDPTGYAQTLAASQGLSISDPLALAVYGSPAAAGGGLVDGSGVDLASMFPSDAMSIALWGVGALLLFKMISGR